MSLDFGGSVTMVEKQVSQALGHKVHMLGLCFLSVPSNCTCAAAACLLSKWFSTPKSLGSVSGSQVRRTWEGPDGRGGTAQNEFSPACLCSCTSFLPSSQPTPCFRKKQQYFQCYLICRYCNELGIHFNLLFFLFSFQYGIECQKRKK